MSLFSRVKILFCVQLFFGLCNAIVINEDHFKCMSREERKFIFETDDGSAPKCEVVECVIPSRSKRSGGESINIMINAFGNLTSTLYVVGDDDLIIRSMTGVWVAQSYSHAYQNVSYYPDPLMFDEIGGFQLLQNVAEGSALTRFWDLYGNETIMGIVKGKYIVQNLPKQFESVFVNSDHESIRAKRSINSINDEHKKSIFLTICKNAEVPPEYFLPGTYEKNDVRPNPNLDRPRRQITTSTNVPKVVYPKLLIILDFDTMNRSRYARDVIVQTIAQLNCVDMLFRQLQHPKVHLSIADIIMSMDNEATPYMLKYADNQINGDATIPEATRHFQNAGRRFYHPKWDAILMLTANRIAYNNKKTDLLVGVNGISSMPNGCSGATGIVRFADNMISIFALAHQLGRMFGAQSHELDNECGDVGNHLMHTNYVESVKFEWSNCSRAALGAHFRSDAESCTYSERIWRLPEKVISMPGAWLTLNGHCDNQYNDSTIFCVNDRSPDCFEYGCKRDGECSWESQPLDGALLFNESGLRACINGKMVGA